MRELLARIRRQRGTVTGSPQNDTAVGAHVGADSTDQHGQIGQRLIDGQVLQIVETGRRRRQVRAEVTVIGGGQNGAHLGGDVDHQTTFDPFGRVDVTIDVNENRSARAEVLRVLRVGLWESSGYTLLHNLAVWFTYKVHNATVLGLEMVHARLECVLGERRLIPVVAAFVRLEFGAVEVLRSGTSGGHRDHGE